MNFSRAGASSSFDCANKARDKVSVVIISGSLRGPVGPAEERFGHGPGLTVGKAPDLLTLPGSLEGVGGLRGEGILPLRPVLADPGFQDQVSFGIGPQREAEDRAVQ